MKYEFVYNNEIIATTDLTIPLKENESIKIFGIDYVAWENAHEVELAENGVNEKIICTLMTFDEYDELKNNSLS